MCLIAVGGYIALFQIFHPKNVKCENVKLGPTPKFYYQPLSSSYYAFLILQETENFQDKTELFLSTKSKNKYQVGTNCHSLVKFIIINKLLQLIELKHLHTMRKITFIV